MAEAASLATEAGFGNTAVRPKGALSGAGGASAAGGRAAGGAAAEGRSAAASEQTRMACYRTATDSHAEKSGSGAGAHHVESDRIGRARSS